MGDRCYFTATVHNEDMAEFNDILGASEWDDLVVGLYGTEVTDGEANYGYFDSIYKAAKAGLRFYGFSGAGGDYTAMVFVGFEREFMALVCDMDGSPQVTVGVLGVSKGLLDYAALYFLALELVQEQLDEIEYAEPEDP